MNKVVTARKGVVCLVRSCWIESREVEHDVEVTNLLYLRIAGDCSAALVREHRISVETLPLLHILAEGYADALTLPFCFGIDSASVVVHNERRTEFLAFVEIDCALVLGEFLPPLGVGIVIRKQRCRERLPFIAIGYRLRCPCQAYGKRSINGFVASS